MFGELCNVFKMQPYRHQESLATFALSSLFNMNYVSFLIYALWMIVALGMVEGKRYKSVHAVHPFWVSMRVHMFIHVLLLSCKCNAVYSQSPHLNPVYKPTNCPAQGLLYTMYKSA